MATHVLGPDKPQTLVTFGAGKQIEAHIELFLNIYPSITQCILVNRTFNQRFAALIERLRNSRENVKFMWTSLSGLGMGFEPNPLSLERIVRSADIICTATPSTTSLFSSSWVKPATHINLVGSFTPKMHEVKPDLIRRADIVAVDQERHVAQKQVN